MWARLLICLIIPDSDCMHICQVDIGSKVLQIVCGASNVAVGQLVVAAIPGAVMPNGLVIKPSHLRGVDRMVCYALHVNSH